MNSITYENQILDAIETLSNNAINNAGYDKTIKGVIIENIDALSGKYKVKYQDSEIEAYSNNTDNIYTEGTLVNILVPNGDFTQTKTILDIVDKDNAVYTSVLEEEEKYSNEGGNMISATNEFGLSSYKINDELILYDEENNINLINFDKLKFEEYVQKENNNFILLGMKVKTELAYDQQKDGNYGIAIEMNFKNSSSENTVDRTYILDINSMVGTPYNFISYTRQSKVFGIINENFVKVNKIYIFSKEFNEGTEEQKLIKDLKFKDFELSSLSALSEEDLNKYSLRITKSGRSYFIEADSDSTEIELSAELLYRMSPIKGKAQYYWFKENGSIKTYSTGYNIYGGEGWECLNASTPNNKITVTKSELKSGSLQLKCVAVKNQNILVDKIVEVKNYDKEFDIIINSSDGTEFFKDYGETTLTCEVQNPEIHEPAEIVGTLSYYWKYTDENNADVIIDENSNTLDVLIAQIPEYRIYNCTVFLNDGSSNILLGTAAIQINNKQETENDYIVNILNGAQTFIYDAMGTSPTLAKNYLSNTPKTEPLTFEIVDSLGNVFGDSTLAQCEVEWIIPENSLFEAIGSINNLTLKYQIDKKYNIEKASNNNIGVKIKFHGLSLEGWTYFNFIKDGEPGTNGSDVICKIVPDTNNTTFNEYPIAYRDGSTTWLNFEPVTAGQWFKVQLFDKGELVNSGYTTKWTILKNSYTNSIKDVSNISCNLNGTNFQYTGYNTTRHPADIVKAEISYKGKRYFCTMPMITVDLNNSNYNIILIKNTGFRYVNYTSDGTQPQYESEYPFTLKVMNNDVDITENMNYTWNIKGEIYNGSAWESVNLLSAGSNLAGNSKFFIPNDIYNGECVNIAVEVEIKDNQNSTIGKIHMPIHFYLYKYGIAALNDWDGNKITLNDELGSILAPQVGAGSKNAQNQFTGVLMGSIKESGSANVEEGLFGYNNGDRTIFLDAHTGKAQFGKTGSGQIILDPTNNTAKIQSGNYVAGTSGMLIDFTTPEIKFGNGKFSVTSGGLLTATGATINGTITAENGNIGGFEISQYNLKGTNVGLSSASGHDWAFWAGASAGENAPFHVGHDGAVYCTDIRATGGTVGGWTLSSTALYTASNNYYLGTTGITATIGGTSRSNLIFKAASNFGVDSSGNLYASGGTIGGWNINSVELQKQVGDYTFEIRSDRSATEPALLVYKNQGANQGWKWYVRPDGYMYTNNAYINGTIESSTIQGSNAYFGNRYSGGQFIYYNNTGFLSCGIISDHPYISGLTVARGAGGVNFYTGSGPDSVGSFRAQIYVGSDDHFVINTHDDTGSICGLLIKGNQIYAKGHPTETRATFGDTHITLNASSGYGYVYASGDGVSNSKVLTNNGQASSKNTKKNIKIFKDYKYQNALILLKNIDIYEYDYKYDLYDHKHQYGFIIDEIEKLDNYKDYFDFSSEKAKVYGTYLDFSLEERKEEKEDGIIEVKRYNSDVLDKYLLTCLKALQYKIDDLENQLNQMKEGK